MHERDILILGGGPSGLSTALHLARDFPDLIPRTLILEKAHYPRPKLCAGGLVIDAEILLQRLGLDPGEVPHVDAERIHFDFEASGLQIRMPKRHALRVILREEFDDWLASKAKSRGVEIREGVTVRNVIPDQYGVSVETDRGNYHAQVVVGADGSNGVTRRCIFPSAPVHTARVLEVITPVNGMRQEAYFDFFPVPSNIAGYVWDFPTQVNRQPMRCWGIYDTNLLAEHKRPQLKEPLAREMSRVGLDLNDYEIKGHPVRWFSPTNQLSVPRVLLVGDAAGADLFLGEGISMALAYGALAAREIGEAFRRNELSFRGYKGRILRSSLGQALLARWLLAHFFYSFKWKWFQILAWRILKPLGVLVAQVFVLNWGRKIT